MHKQVIEVEELTDMQSPEIEEEKQDDKAVKFITEVPERQSDRDREVQEINMNKRRSLAIPESLNKSTTITSKQFVANSVRAEKLRKSHHLSRESTINRDGIFALLMFRPEDSSRGDPAIQRNKGCS